MAQAGGIGLGEILLRDFTSAGPLPLDKSLPLRAYSPNHAPEAQIPFAPEAPARNMEFRFPVRGDSRVSSGFGMRTDPMTGEERFHHGIDIAAAEGTPVFPAAPGRVVFSGLKGGYGNLVEVLHDDGHITRYGHNAENLVKAGDRVDTSRPIAYVGSTGRSTGPHLHFEVLMNGIALNPDTFYG
ncbi:MAG: M23 family metallopeptidase [Deltaproteobacteria bacterium]|nr:M23 family metallopeptidase [Deltaproteobacteria bacterium]MBZ0219256.1 M23 family metallopeptidase [Deltaproteobacteria bacterium]